MGRLTKESIPGRHLALLPPLVVYRRQVGNLQYTRDSQDPDPVGSEFGLDPDLDPIFEIDR